MHPSATQTAATSAASGALASGLRRHAAPLLALLLGLTILGVTGFAQAPVLHNAAHDVRHVMNFPCH